MAKLISLSNMALGNNDLVKCSYYSEVINDIAMSLNSNIYKLIYFDKVSHPRLLYKLQHYGINSPLFNWRITVVLDGASSTSLEVILRGQSWDPCFT